MFHNVRHGYHLGQGQCIIIILVLVGSFVDYGISCWNLIRVQQTILPFSTQSLGHWQRSSFQSLRQCTISTISRGMQEGPFSGIGIIPSDFLGVVMLNIDTVAKSLDLGSVTTFRDFQCDMVVGPFSVTLFGW